MASGRNISIYIIKPTTTVGLVFCVWTLVVIIRLVGRYVLVLWISGLWFTVVFSTVFVEVQPSAVISFVCWCLVVLCLASKVFDYLKNPKLQYLACMLWESSVFIYIWHNVEVSISIRNRTHVSNSDGIRNLSLGGLYIKFFFCV